MNKLTNVWNYFLTNKLYFDLALFVIAISILMFAFTFEPIQIAVYLYGCFCLGSKIGGLVFNLANKLK